MKKLYTLLVLTIIMVTTSAFGQGVETFTKSNASNSYDDGNFVGDGGITWAYVESRDENGDANNSGIDGNALMLRYSSGGSKVTSSTISGGIGSLSVKLYKGFTGVGDRKVEVFVNGISKGISTGFDDNEEHVFTVNDINIFGDFTIEIKNITSKQVIVDDITWTGYSAPATPYTVSFDAGAGTYAGGDLTESAGGAGVTLPIPTLSTACADAGWSFAGWAAAVVGETTTAPTLFEGGDTYNPTEDCELYAVYSMTETNSTTVSSDFGFETGETGWTRSGGTINSDSKRSGAKGCYINVNNVYVTYDEIITTPQEMSFYFKRTSTNSKNYIAIEKSTNNEDWTGVVNYPMGTSGFTKDEWVKKTCDLSTLSNVYIRIHYNGTTAIRHLDDISLSMIAPPTTTYNSNPDCAPACIEPTITFSDHKVAFDEENGTTIALSTLFISNSTGAKEYNCSDENVIIVDDGFYTTDAGIYTVTVTQAATATHCEATATAIITVGIPQLPAPINLTLVSSSATGATISWDAVPNAESYTVVCIAMVGPDLPDATGITGTTYTFSGLDAQDQYLCSVIAVGDGVNYLDSDESDESLEITFCDPRTVTFSDYTTNLVNDEATVDLSILFTSDSEDAVTYACESGSNGKIIGENFVAKAAGTYTVTATQAASGNYCDATDTAIITITPPCTEPTITVTPFSGTFVAGSTTDLSDYFDSNSDGAMEYTCSGEGFTITGDIFSAEVAGSYTIIATQAADGIYCEASAELTITLNAPTFYTVSFDAEGGTCGTASLTQSTSGGSVTLPPAAPSAECASYGWTFAGWTAATVAETTTVPTILMAGGSTYKPTEDITLHAVYQNTISTGDEYSKIYDVADVTSGDYVIIGHYSSQYYPLPNGELTSGAIVNSTAIIISSNTITTSDASLIWKITNTGTSYTIYNSEIDKYLSLSGGTLSHSDAAFNFTLSESSDKFNFQGGGKSLSFYGGAKKWNAFSRPNDVYLFKNNSTTTYNSNPNCVPKTKLATPVGLSAAPESFSANLSWGSVENAESYTVVVKQGETVVETITEATSPLTVDELSPSTDYSFTVTAIADPASTYADSDESAACPFTTLDGPKYTVTLNNMGAESDLTETTYQGGVALPTPDVDACIGWIFAGWADVTVAETTTEPTLLTGTYTPSGDCTLYAVYSKTEGGDGGSGTFSILPDDFIGGNGYQTGSYTKGGIEISYSDAYKNGTIQTKGKIYNSTAMPGDITKIEVVSTKYDYEVYIGASEEPTTNKTAVSSGNTTITNVPAGNKYFSFGHKGYCLITSFTVTYATTTTTYTTTPSCIVPTPLDEPRVISIATANTIQAYWSRVEGAASYAVKLDGGTEVVIPAHTYRYKFTGLAASTDYDITVVAKPAADDLLRSDSEATISDRTGEETNVIKVASNSTKSDGIGTTYKSITVDPDGLLSLASQTITADLVVLNSSLNAQPEITLGSAILKSKLGTHFNKTLTAGKFYFFSIPFDCAISDVYIDGENIGAYGTAWLVSYYDESFRANNYEAIIDGTASSWRDLAAGDTLRANTGYTVAIASGTKTLTFPHIATAAEYDVKFQNSNTQTLTATANDNALHKGWNLVTVPAYGSTNKGKITISGSTSAAPVTMPHTDGYNYIQKLSTDEDIAPFYAFFLQTATNNSTATFTYPAAVQSAPRRPDYNTMSEIAEPEYIKITISQDTTVIDETTISLYSTAPDEYWIGYDLQKMSAYSGLAQIYTIDYGTNLAFNARTAMESDVIPLGVFTPEAEDYTVTVSADGVSLFDTETNSNLGSQFTFTGTPDVKTDDRYQVLISRTVTGEANTTFDEVNVLTNGGRITIDGLSQDAAVSIYTATGQLLSAHSKTSSSITINNVPDGVYLIKLTDKTQATTIKAIVKQ